VDEIDAHARQAGIGFEQGAQRVHIDVERAIGQARARAGDDISNIRPRNL
jgi:hypothetical protein